jgi:hypothetical protein
MIHKKKIVLFALPLFFLFLNSMSLLAQDKNSFKTISITGHSGAHIYSGKTLDDKVEFGYSAVNIKFSWQPSVDNEWTRDTGYASYGIGFFTGNLGDPQVFGQPNALYGFINFFLSNSQSKHIFEIAPAFGLTYNLNPYNPETNPLNDAIGARMAVYFSLNFGAAYKMNREIDLLYGVDFTHFSNGRTFTPNYGLNMFGLNVGARYNFNLAQKKYDKDPYTTNVLASRFHRPERPKTVKKAYKNSIDIVAAIGTTQNDEDAGTSKRYANFTGTIDYRRYFNKMHGTTIGLDFFYDESLSKDYPNKGDQYLVGIHGGYDLMFWRFGIRVQVGTYLTDDFGKGGFYLRPAIQYEITKNLITQFALKTKAGAAADWMEFGIGWKPFKW